MEQNKCKRCGLPQGEWKGRWEEPLCKVGGTTYDQHILNISIPQNNWEKEFDVKFCQKSSWEGVGIVLKEDTPDGIKSFISSLLSQHNQKLLEQIEGIPNATRNEVDNEKVICLSNVKNLLTKEK